VLRVALASGSPRLEIETDKLPNVRAVDSNQKADR
jgi:hypothetical protein